MDMPSAILRHVASVLVATASIGFVVGCRKSHEGTSQVSLTKLAATAVSIYPSRIQVSEDRSSPCVVRHEAVAIIARLQCDASVSHKTPSQDLVALAERVSHAVTTHPTPDALRAAALLDVSLSDTDASAFDRPVTYLRAATLLGDTAVGTRVDLSAALLMRAGRDSSVRDVVEALDVAAQAVRLEPRNRAAQFDFAFALSELGLVEEARQAWANYVSLDSVSAWADQARFFLTDATLAIHDAHEDSDISGASRIDSLAIVDAQRARTVGWDTVLVRWARAAIAKDRSQEAEALGLATHIGLALQHAHGDASLAMAARAIANPSMTDAAIQTLARGHLAYADGQRAYEQGDFDQARRLFARAVEDAGSSPALLEWSRLFHGATIIYLGDKALGMRELHRVISQASASIVPALIARGHWMLGTTLLRADDLHTAMHEFDLAAGLFEGSRERENLGAVRCLIADTKFRVGTRDDFEAMHAALQTLLPYRRSVWLHDLLYTASKAAAADGYTNAALYFQREGITVAAHTAEPLSIIEARLSLARLLGSVGQRDEALRQVNDARRALRDLHSSYAHDWLDADLRLTLAQLQPASMSPKEVDPAVEFFARHDVQLRLIPALLARARVSLVGGEQQAAASDLRRAASLIRVAAAHTDPGPDRDALQESSRGVFDELTKLAVGRGAVREALMYQQLSGESRDPTMSAGTLSAPTDGTVLQYALIDDTLYAWIESQGRIAFRRWAAPRGALESDENALLGHVTLAGDDTDLRRLLGRLFDALVRPILTALPNDSGPITIVESSDLAPVPFAALFDTATERYFVQSRMVRYALSSEATTRSDARPPRPSTRVGLIADPAFDRRLDPDLRPLPSSRAEVEAVSRLYDKSRTLIGAQADKAAVSALFRWAQIIHYAGHVEYDDGRPEGSRLILAGNARSLRDESIRPRDIRSMDLKRVRLVVLSSCQALPAAAAHGQGLTNLASSFLDAGARGVVAGEWPVSDEQTAHLMISFQTFYAKSSSAPAALRDAQLAMLRSASPALRSPATWAGFRFIAR